MGMEKIYPKQKESFGTLLLQKRIEDKVVWNNDLKRREITHYGYELESSVQEGAIIVYIPAKEKEIDCSQHRDEEVTLISPVLELSETDVRNGKAVYEIYATRIQLGGVK